MGNVNGTYIVFVFLSVCSGVFGKLLELNEKLCQNPSLLSEKVSWVICEYVCISNVKMKI